MDRSSLFVVIVPGRDDRAFYKRFFHYVARKLGFQLIDLDSRSYVEEKQTVLDRICKQHRRTMGVEESGEEGGVLRGTSVIRLLSTGTDRAVYVVIVPSERRVTQIASTILGYQAGQEEPSIDFMVVADDAEERDFEEKLTSMYNSLRSAKHLDIGDEVSRGNYYRLYILKRPKDVRLMLFVQGLRDIRVVTKHAVEDYVLYLHEDMLNEILGAVGRDLRDNMHKKLALAIALRLCYTRIEELFLQGLDDSRLGKLLQACDSLRTLAVAVVNALGTKRVSY